MQRRRTHRTLPLPLRGCDEGGFSLIEVMVALFMVLGLSVASASFFLSATRTTADQSLRETALTLANQAIAKVQSVPVDSVLQGRTKAAVDALVASPTMAPLVVQDVVTADNYDTSGVSTPLIPISETQVVKQTSFLVRTAINPCWLSKSRQACLRANPGDGVSVLRATANVTWGATNCARCSYSASALLDRQDDPVFQGTSQPIITTVTPSTVVTGKTVAITLTGRDFAARASLSVGTGGGSFTTPVLVGTDGRKMTANWQAGMAPGPYTMVLLNTDTGRAEYSPLTVQGAVNDCTATKASGGAFDGYYYSAVRLNDVPASTGTVTITSTSAGGSSGAATLDGEPVIGFKPTAAASVQTYTVTYTLTLGGVVSAPATVTIKANGSCP